MKPSDYLLSDAENSAIFEQLIRPAELGEPSVERASSPGLPPLCVLLAGQTGAGKSHAAPAFVRALTRGSSRPPIHLVADTHKPYHPAYAALLADAAAGRCPPGLPSAATGPDARRWLARAAAAAATTRRSVLVESASRFPADVVALARVFRRGGYRVCVVAVAAAAVQSRLGLLARFLDPTAATTTTTPKAEGEEDTKTTAEGERTTDVHRPPPMPVRLTPRTIHDESYAGLTRLAAWLDGTAPLAEADQLPPLRPVDDDHVPPPPQPPVDAVLVLRRGNRVALAQYYGPDRRLSGPVVARTLDAERQRLLPAERAQFAADVARLRAAAHPGRAGELEALASECAAVGGGDDQKEEDDDLPELDADALVARLQAENL